MKHPTGIARVIAAQGRKSIWVAASLDPPVDPSTVTRWCNGERDIPRSRIEELSKLLGVPVEELTDEIVAA